MGKLKHWTAFVIFWAFVGPLIMGGVAGLLYALYLFVVEFTDMVVTLASVGAIVLVIRWAGNYLDRRGFLPWKPKG
jgi:hypothetical protein